MLKKSVLWMTVFFTVVSTSSGQDELARIEQVEKTMQSVIAVFPASEGGPMGGGSGVVISPDGYALTNFHVVQPCGVAMKCGMSDGKAYNAILVGVDPTGDIALIKLLGRNDFPYASLGNSDLVQIGDEALVMGNPFMLAIDFRPCVSYGIISGTHRYQYPAGTFLEYTDCLQTDAAVNPGNSGGPLFNIRGELIGINGRCSFDKRGRFNVGIGYAVSINQIVYFLGDLKSGRIVDHASLGATLATDRIGRVIVDDILIDSELYRLGVRADDEIVRFAGRSLDTANTFKNILGIFPRDWRLPISLRTPKGERHELFVRLDGLHGEAELVRMTEKMMPPALDHDAQDDEKKEQNEQKKQFELKPGEMKPGDLKKKMQELQQTQKPLPVPDWAKPLYEKRQGFSNYYFNRLELDRTLSVWRSLGKQNKNENSSEPWTISGTLLGNAVETNRFTFTLTDDDLRFHLPRGEMRWNPLQSLDDGSGVDPISYFQEPMGSGGMFAPLYLLRKLATSEKLDFGEIMYVGTAPLDDEMADPQQFTNVGRLYDVVSVVWKSARGRFYFDPETGMPRRIEFYPLERRFPCEIRIFYDTTTKDQPLKEIHVYNGMTPYATFKVDSGQFQSRDRKEAENNQNHDQHDRFLTGAALTAMVIETTKQKVIKIYGSGGMAGMQGYQAGCLITPFGHIVTVSSSALEADPLNVVLDNGRKYKAELLAADPALEIAILKIDAEDLPFFDLKLESPTFTLGASEPQSTIQIGDRILAVSNPYNIATGNEPVSFFQGVISAKTSLRARRGMFATPYKGPVYVVDAITNNPGAKGGAVVLQDSGQFVGLIGKELKNAENNTWFNYVLPARELHEKIRTLLLDSENKNGDTTKRRVKLVDLSQKPELEPLPAESERIFRNWGIILVSNIANRTPPFVDSVRPGSEAEKIGIKPDDLIVMVNNRLTPSRNAVEQQVLATEKDEPVLLTIERDAELHEFKLLK